ncbi:polygalacturonase adpg2 [Citrus sinensis]|nr:polygalacturonase adpg2 [Citrus sinensis]
MDLVASICILILLSTLATHINVNADDQNTFNVLNYGAVGNGNSDDSLAYAKAWNDACKANAQTPTMIIPKGKTFLVHPITFSGPCKSSNISIQLSGTIKAPDGPSAWTSEIERWIVFGNITGLNINGRGHFDGNGQKWWDQSCKHHPGKDCSERAPTAVSFIQCNNVHINEIYVERSPQVHIVVDYSQDVHFKSLIIDSPETSPNTDGIHIARSHDVSVHTSIIAAGDDCISISDQTSNISVTYVNCGPGHGISIGSLGKNGEEVKVENITVRHVNFCKTTNGARIKTWQAGKGQVQHVEFSYMNFTEVQNPIIIDQYYCDQKDVCAKTSTGVHISDVRYLNATGTSATDVAINLDCSNNVACTDIKLENIELQSATEGKGVLSSCKNAFGVAKGNWKLLGHCLTEKAKKRLFNLLKPPEVPADVKGFDIEKLRYQLKHDYDVGVAYTEEIISHAVGCYTGNIYSEAEGCS